MSPLQRTHALLKEQGYEVAKTEHWNHYAKRRQDLYGFIDTLAVSAHTMKAIQTTDASHLAEHVAKVMLKPAAHLLAFHMEIEIWSWSKKGARGKRKLWTLKVTNLTAKLLPKNNMLRRKMEEGTWDVEPIDFGKRPTTTKGTDEEETTGKKKRTGQKVSDTSRTRRANTASQA